ncbi:MAG: hypothetical protein ISR65_03210 [Bacteriovoracaceae bacterium]|nr:hypothetical protein [Bacteriovoracaceae bacterium]
MENETSVAEVGSVKINLPHQIEDVVIKEQLRKISDLRIDEIVNISADQFEKNIKDMLSSIKELDYSLKCSLDLSQTLKKEAQENDEKIKGLMEENQKLNKRILDLENSIPQVKDIEMKMDLTHQELNKYKGMYAEELAKVERRQEENTALKSSYNSIKEECEDLKRENSMFNTERVRGLSEKDEIISDLERRLKTASIETVEISKELEQTKEELVSIYKTLNVR